jgi:hypothetical protein
MLWASAENLSLATDYSGLVVASWHKPSSIDSLDRTKDGAIAVAPDIISVARLLNGSAVGS